MSQTMQQRLSLARVTQLAGIANAYRSPRQRKLDRAKEILGDKWLLHPANRVQRKTPHTWRHPMEDQS